jgi:hypothetical protein
MRGHPGQYPTFLFFGAVHALLLAGADHPLARYYPSIVGDAALPSSEAGPALLDFCDAFAPALATIIETRLVQTNVVKRAMALCLGLVAIGRQVIAPIHLVEIGASAGLLLSFNRYGYTLGGSCSGDPHSPVQIAAEWRDDGPPPDLDALPPLASVTGIDLNPLDARNEADRRWLEALVWPENREELALLRHALSVVAAHPPQIHAGDAIDLCPLLADQIPPGEPRVAFHAVTRLHVPRDRRAAFDAAITSLGQHGPLYQLSLEGEGDLDLRDPSGTLHHLAKVGERGQWIAPRSRGTSYSIA